VSKFFVGLILFILATIPTAILTVVTSVFTFFYYIITLKWKSGVSTFGSHLHGMALSIDQFANKALAPVLNLIMVMRKMDYHPFGDEDDTLSYVIAMNYAGGTLSDFGWFWAIFLNLVDFPAKKEGTTHLEKTISNKKKRDKEAVNRLIRQGIIKDCIFVETKI
jgi:hypothetical protein